jgi:hypothetical protein
MPSRRETGTDVPSLRAMQLAFFRALDSGVAGTTSPDAELVAVIQGTAALDVTARVDVYAQMYWMRIADALLEDYPRIAALVGRERFQALVRAYLCRTPSRHPSLSHIGAGFADFLALQEHVEDVPPFAADLARLEWSRRQVFTAADARILTLADLRQVAPDDWPTLRLRAIPALTLLELHWPAHEIWAAEGHVSGWSGDPAPTSLRIWRDDSRVYQTRVDAAEHPALIALRAGTTFGDVCTALATVTSEDRATEDAAALLLRWIEDRMLAAEP